MQMIKRILKFSEMLSCSPLISLPSSLSFSLSLSLSLSLSIHIYILLSLKKNNFKLTFCPFPDLSVELNEN